EAAVRTRTRILGIGPKDLVEVLDCLGELTLADEQASSGRPRLDARRAELDPVIQIVQGLVELALVEIREATHSKEASQGGNAVFEGGEPLIAAGHSDNLLGRAKMNGPVKVVDCFGVLALLHVEQGAVQQGDAAAPSLFEILGPIRNRRLIVVLL